MSTHPIEVEVRAELSPEEVARVRETLLAQGFTAHDIQRRTMLMSFGRIGRIPEDQDGPILDQETDIRCRVTNGKAEVVVKLGAVHADNRQEMSQPISPESLGAFARVVGTLNMLHKVGSRTTENFQRGATTASIVSSRSGLTYLELEKMSDKEHAESDRQELHKLSRILDITLWPGREAFIEFCTRLTERDDWRFYGSEKDVKRFLQEAESTGATRVTP